MAILCSTRLPLPPTICTIIYFLLIFDFFFLPPYMRIVPSPFQFIAHPGLCNGDRAGIAKNSCANYTMPGDGTASFTAQFRMKNHTLSSTRTAYTKQLFKLSEVVAAAGGSVSDYYAFRFNPYIDPSNTATHHMLLYGCPGDTSNSDSEAGKAWSRGFYDNPSDDGQGMPCTDIKYAWAVGGKDFCTPSGVAFPFDATTEYLLLEMHYDNPLGRSDWTDASGVDIEMIPKAFAPGTESAGFVWLGALPGEMSIPAKQSAYEIRNTITLPASLTSGFAKVFATLIHGHKYMTSAWTEISRNGKYETDAACTSAYDYDLQEFVPTLEEFPLSGSDKLTTRCIYDTSSSDVKIHGGDATDDEMCIIFLMYYPLLPNPSDTFLLKKPSFMGAYSEGKRSCNAAGSACGGSGTTSASTADTMTISHGVLMAVAWCLLLPSGVAIAAFRAAIPGDGRWFVLHRLIQVFGVVLTLGGFGLAVAMVSEGHFSGNNAGHKILGLVTVILAALQPLNAVLRPHAPEGGADKTAKRRNWEYLHKSSGYVALACGLANCILGALATESKFGAGSANFAWITLGTCLFLTLISIIILALRRRSARKILA